MSDYEQTEALPISPGFLLQEARKKLNLTIEEVAIRLLLKEAVVIGLENDDYGTTLSPTFIKGYIRSYAKLVGLDPEEMIAAYNDISGVDTQQKSKMQSFSRKISRDTYDSRWMYVTYGIIAVVIILIGLFAWQNTENGLVDISANTDNAGVLTNQGTNEPTARNLGTSSQNPAQTPATSSTEGPSFANKRSANTLDADSTKGTDNSVNINSDDFSSELSSDNNSLVTDLTGTDSSTNDAETELVGDNIPEFVEAESDRNINTVLAALENADPDATEALTTSTDSAANTLGSNAINDAQQNTLLNIGRDTNESNIEDDVFVDSVELVFTFEQDCWIKITDATGEDIAYGVKKAGRVMPVSGQAPFSVILGAPKGVAITFAGNDVDISAFPTNATARFTLPLQETL